LKAKRHHLACDGFRFWLRPCEESNGDAIFEAADESRARVGKWMDWLTPSCTRDDARGWARAAADDWGKGNRYEFVIIDSTDGVVSGCCGLNRINEADLVCNLGYWVRESKIRQGAAAEAARVLAKFGHEEAGLRRIEIVIAMGNSPSRKVAEKIGAISEGIQRMRLRVGDVSHDARMYALLAKRCAPEVT
jgi:RimJ/RimL family protein N-acetyltransferase